MSISQSHPQKLSATPPLLSLGGLDRCLGLTHDLNEQLLLLLRKLSFSPRPGGLQLAATLRAQLQILSPSDIHRAAKMPFLLCEFAFADPATWTRWSIGRSAPPSFQHPMGGFPSDAATTLTRGLLTTAWIVSCQEPRHAALLFGMIPNVCSVLAQLKMSDLERIAIQESRQLRPRWETRFGFWDSFLTAARDPDDRVLQASRVYGLQLLAGEHLRRNVHAIPDQTLTTPTSRTGLQDSRPALRPGMQAPHRPVTRPAGNAG